ncbi:MAG: MFS transporter [Nitrosotalea sp.]
MSSKDSSKKEERLGMRNVYAMGIVSLFTDFSTEMILGLLPLFIVTNLGATRAALGAIEGSAELVSYSSRMVSGPLSDKIGKRKALVIIGYALSTVSKPFFAATHGWLDAFAVRVTDRVGKGIRTPPRDALIADSVPVTMAGKAFGFHRALDNIGAVAGPVAAFALLQVMDVRSVFLMSLIPGVISVLVLFFVVKEIAIKSSVKRTMLSNISVLYQNCNFVYITGLFHVPDVGTKTRSQHRECCFHCIGRAENKPFRNNKTFP